MNANPNTFSLYHYWRSSASWRVRMALHLKGVSSVQYHAVDLTTDATDQPEFRLKNPSGTVPVLEIKSDPQKASFFLTESTAIIEWLNETYPNPPLLPVNPLDRAMVRSFCQIINSGIHPLQNPPVSQFHSKDPAEQKKWNQHFIRLGLENYEAWAVKTSGSYSFENSVTAADLFLIPQLYNAVRFDVPYSDLKTLVRVETSAKAQSWYVATHPDCFKPVS